MKFLRTYEDISQRQKDLIDESLELIKLLWDEKLKFFNANIVPDVDIKLFHFYSKITATVNTYEWKYFKEFFDFLVSAGIQFSYKDERVDFTINDIEGFIDRLRELKEIKKFNL